MLYAILAGFTHILLNKHIEGYWSSIAGPVSVHAGCAGYSCYIYVDGQLSGRAPQNGRHLLKAEFDRTPSLIAIRCNSGSYSGYILASLSNGLISGTSWKCIRITSTPPDWNYLGYDDSGWDQAVVVEDDTPIADVSNEDATIWSSTGAGDVSYCRGIVGKHFTQENAFIET